MHDALGYTLHTDSAYPDAAASSGSAGRNVTEPTVEEGPEDGGFTLSAPVIGAIAAAIAACAALIGVTTWCVKRRSKP